MKNFFKDFKKSLSDWNFYKEIVRGSHPLRLSYAFCLSVITCLLLTVVMIVALYAFALPFGKVAINEHFPADFEATLRQGELSINQPMPYVFEIPDEETFNERDNFLVIDTNASSSLDAPEQYNTLIFANRDTIIMEKESGEVRAVPLKDFPDVTISQEILLELLDAAQKYIWILPLLLFIPVLAFNFVGLLITLAAAAGLLYLIASVSSRRITYRNAFIATMYAYTFVFIINLIFMLPGLGGFGFLSSVIITALLAAVLIFVLGREASSQTVPPNETQ